MKMSGKECLFIVLIYIFALQFGVMQKISIFQYWDEFYAGLCIPLAFLQFNGKIKLKKEKNYIKKLISALILFVLLGVIPNCIYKYQEPFSVFKDIFTNLKFFMGIATTYYLFKDLKISTYRKQIQFHTKLLILIFLILVLQNKRTHIFSVADMRFGLSAEKIFFNHPTELASVTFFLLLILMISYNNKKKNIFFVSMAVIVILSTLRFKAIVTVMLFIYMYFIVISGKKMRMIYLAPLIPFVLAIGGDEFYFYFFSTNSMDMARGALSFTSIKIAIDNFPLGTGFGTFASWASGTSYSPVYSLYGISGVWGLTKDWPQLVSDVFWPMVIAQNGFLGLILYFMILYYLFRIVMQCSKFDKKLFLGGIGALLYLFISSIAESAFVNPLALSLSFIIGMCICAYKQEEIGGF